MAKSFLNKRLCLVSGRIDFRRRPGRRHGRCLGENGVPMIGPSRGRAFTLSELVVAVGILALMMALAGEVFSIAVKSTGQATALTHVSQQLRILEQTLREDLRHVRPDTSLLVIQSNPVKAYWTQHGREADSTGNTGKDPTDGYPHIPDPEREKYDDNDDLVMVAPRADILMFVTQRTGARSVVFPKVTADAQQVVYGHTLSVDYFADQTAACSGYRSYFPMQGGGQKKKPPVEDACAEQFPRDTECNSSLGHPVPASKWHLGRRVVLLSNKSLVPPPLSRRQMECLGLIDHIPLPYSRAPNEDDDLPIEAGLMDVVYEFSLDAEILDKVGALPPYTQDDVCDECTGICDSIVDFSGSDEYGRGKWLRRSILDETLPAPIGDRIGHYLLPNCASFKVEWTMDPDILGGGDRVLWFDYDHCIGVPGPAGVHRAIHEEIARLEKLENGAENSGDDASAIRFRNRKDRLIAVSQDPGSGGRPDDPDYFRYDPRFPDPGPDPEPCSPNCDLETIPGVFWFPQIVPVTVDRSGRPVLVCSPKRDPLFPVALRITVDVYDENLRLERPIRHVMVIPLGE